MVLVQACPEYKKNIKKFSLQMSHTSRWNRPVEKYPLLKEFPQLYNKLGKIEVGGPINIKLKDGTMPHQTYSPRHIPFIHFWGKNA